MTGERSAAAEESLARGVFGPLGGVVALAALAGRLPSQGTGDASVSAFAADRREPLDRLIGLIQQIGGFRPETMAIIDQLGWHDDHPAAGLLPMWSEGAVSTPPRLDDPAEVRRGIETGSDLQLAYLLQSLVSVSVDRAADPRRSAEPVTEAIGLAATLLGLHPLEAARDTFRLWRVLCLRPILHPGGGATEDERDVWRSHADALDDLTRPAPR